MKRHLFFILSLLIFCVSLRAAPEPPSLIFVGYFVTKGESLYKLKEPQAGTVSGWLRIGDSFSGATIERHDVTSETLTVQTSDGRFDLKIQNPTVKPAINRPAPSVKEPPTHMILLGGALQTTGKFDPYGSPTGYTLAEAIVAAGGFKEGAKANEVKVTRRESGTLRTFTVDATPDARGPNSASAFVLRPRDIVMVSVESERPKTKDYSPD